ncbi:hypothetical protein ACFX15_007935 [Malus domestica]
MSHIFKKLKATVRGGGGARTPNVKVELNILVSHPKNIVRVTSHPDNQEMATRLVAAAHTVRADFFDRLAQFNLVVATGEFAMKVYRVFVKAKQSGLNEAVKGVVKGGVCSFKMDGRLDDLLAESKTHSLKMNYITEMMEHVAKHSGCPLPPRPPAPSSKEEAKGNGGGANGHGGGANHGGTKGNGGGDGGVPPEPLDFF